MSVIFINPYRFGVAYDADAQAYFDRVEGVNGDNQPLETAVKDAINAFVVGCKADGIWTAIKASCILAGARTLNGALQPLVGAAPTNVGPFVAGDYNRKTGLVGDGGTKYLNSNRNSNADPQNNLHLAVRLTSTGSVSKVFVGALSSSSPLLTSQVSITSAGLVTAFANSGTNSSEISPSVPTVVGISRTNSSQHLFRINATTYTGSSTSAAPGAFPHYVFARNNSNSSVIGHTDARLAFYSIGEALDLALLDARVTALINAFAAAIP